MINILDYKNFINENNSFFNSEQLKTLKMGLENHYSNDDERIDDEIKYLESLLNKNGEIDLYRIVFLPDIKFLDENIGKHWTLDKTTISNYKESLKDNAYEEFMFDYNGEEDFILDDFNVFLINAKTNISNIDIDNTIDNFINFPLESEASIIDYDKIIVKNIEKLDN